LTSFQAAVSGTLEPKATNDSSEDDDNVLSGLLSHHSDMKMNMSLDDSSRANSSMKKSSLHPNKKIRHK
jgi:hypothetical protein